MVKKPKIIYLITQSELGGAQENVLNLAMGFKDKYDVLVAAGPDGDGKFFKRLADNGIRWQKLRWLRRSATNPLTDIAGFCQILSLFIKERPNLVHLHSSKAGFLGSLAGKLAGIKVIYTVHGAIFAASFSKIARTFFFCLEKFSAYFKDKIICVSANDKKLWLKYKAAPENKLIVIHNGINLKTDFLSRQEAREYLASQSANFFEALRGSGENLKIIGTIANFFPEKGLPYSVEAADILVNKKKIKNIIFAIMGDGPERLLLEETLKERGLTDKLILLGSVANPFRYLKAFDIFVLPSIKEGLPYAILWAMAAGLPIIASHVGGLPEMITNNANGFLLFPRDTDGLAKKIMELLDNPALCQKFAFNSQQKIKEFSLEKMVAETEKVYLDQ